MGWSRKEAAFLFSKIQTSEFYSPLVSQIPKRLSSQELLRLFLKLNFPASPASTVPHSPKASLTKEDEHGMTVHGRGAQAGTGDLVMPLPWTGKRLRAGSPGSRNCRVVYSILLPSGNPLPSISVPIFIKSPWWFWGLDTPKQPQPLNFWPALIYWIICQVAAFFYFVAWTLAIIKIILEALTEHWWKSFPQSLQQNH